MRLLYTSTRKNTDVIIQRAIEKLGNKIEFVLHLGDMDADIKATSMTRMNMKKAKKKQHIMANKNFKGYLSVIANQDMYEKNAALFIDHLHRLDDRYRYKSHNLATVYDYLDYYHILYDVMATKIIDNEITHMFFSNVPHLGFDTICYQIGKALGLQTVIITQSLFPHTFFSMYDIEDYGTIVHNESRYAPVPIERDKNIELLYMKDVGQERGATGRISVGAVFHFLLYLVRRKPGYFLKPAKAYQLLDRTMKVYNGLPKWRDPFAKFFHEDQLAYFEHIVQYEENAYDMELPFVYFPLHMQPEMTTASLGDAFRDQATAIECLAGILPEHVKIYVKENPKQGAYMRGPLFYHRLRRIPSVVILPSYANTYALTQHAEFIATITGTVGWEALCKGKKVLVFGRAWYLSLPGVFPYTETVSYEEIINYTLDHTELEYAFGILMGRSHKGIVDKWYVNIVEAYDAKANIENASETIAQLLTGEAKPTFG